MTKIRLWARGFATGLSSLRDRAAARLAGSRFNPSRCRDFGHEWRIFGYWSDWDGPHYKCRYCEKWDFEVGERWPYLATTPAPRFRAKNKALGRKRHPTPAPSK